MSVLCWNSVLLEASRRDFTKDFPNGQQPGPIRTSRAMAIVHLAIHDAVAFHSGMIPQAYLTKSGISHTVPPVPPGASLEEVIAGAAVTAIRAMYPSHGGPLDDSLASTAGFPVGVAIARALIDHRSHDGWDVMLHDDQLPAPGRFKHRADPHQPSQRRLGPKWGLVWRFAKSVRDAEGRETHHLPLKPYPVARYAKELAEVRDYGAVGRGSRSADQERIGVFWGYDGANGVGVPPRLYNQVARAVIAQAEANGRKFSIAELADIFARVNVAMADAAIDAWHWKYVYDLWRPVVGVREEPSPEGDPFWCPYGVPRTNNTHAHYSPDFPAYPSGHATFGAALFQALRLKLDPAATAMSIDEVLAYDDKETPPAPDAAESFTFVSDELNGASRDPDGSARTRVAKTFGRFAEAVWENSVSRIYLGVHWRFDGIPEPTDEHKDQIGGVPLGLAVGVETNDFFNGGGSIS